jgi:uncharacterized membrane protein
MAKLVQVQATSSTVVRAFVFLILMTRFCLFGSQLKVLGTLEAQLLLGLAFLTLQP